MIFGVKIDVVGGKSRNERVKKFILVHYIVNELENR